MDRTILHCDLNNFYASVEQKNHPELSGLPIAVCGNPEQRHGIVLAKNQIAKMQGVKTAEQIWEAKQKCPNLVCVPPHFDEYVKYSKKIFSLYTEFTDRVEPFGIDECWLDVTGSLRLFGTGKEIADTIREEVKKRFGLTISVGVSFTKVLAKLGSDLKKPDATSVLDRAHYMDIVGNMAPGEMIMIGAKTAEKLKDLNINTIRDLACANREMLVSKFGVIAENLIDYASGSDTEEVKHYYDIHIPKSVSNGTTTPRNIENVDEAKMVIYALTELIGVRLRSYDLIANGVSIQIKNPNLHTVSKQCPLPFPTSNASDIAEAALKMLISMHDFSMPLRAITVGAIRLQNKDNIQLSFFDNGEKEEKLEESIDEIRKKYGYSSVKRGILLNNDLATGLHEEDGYKPFDK